METNTDILDEAESSQPVIEQANNHAAQHAHFRMTKQRRSIILGLVAGVTVFILGLALNMWRGSLSSVTVAGIPVNNKTSVADLEDKLNQMASAYRLEVALPDNTKANYALADMGITIDTHQAALRAVQAKTTGPLLERLQWWHSKAFAPPYKADDEKFKKFIDEKLTAATKEPVNAKLVIDSGNVTISPEIAGEGNAYADADQRLPQLFSDLKSDQISLSKQTLPAKLTAVQLQPLKQRVEGIIAQKVTFNLAGKTFTPDAATIGSWIDLPDFNIFAATDIEINSGKIQAYLDSIAKPYIQPTKSQIMMQTDTGPVLIARGQDGTDVTNKTEVATAASKALIKGEAFSQDLSISTDEYDTVNAEDYDKWIVVDVTNKQLYAYEKNKLVKQYPVSAGAPATPTVIGQYKIYAKVRAQDMRGLNADGTTYFQPKVEWTNYFYGSYAIHGNYWRPAYWFGSINSSHGCVGLQDVNAEWIYNWAPVGTPVITHL